jgi:hypothetical protein
MPLTALIMSAILLNRGSIPFDLFGLFGRDSGPESPSGSADVRPDADGGERGLPPATDSAVAASAPEAADPDGEGGIRKFRVAIAPPDFDEDERLGAIAIQTFHDYLVAALEAIPHLEIVELPAPTDQLTPEDADFYLETGGERHPGPPATWMIRVRWTATREGTATWSKIHESVESEVLLVSAREAAASLRRYPFPPPDARAVELQSVALDSDRDRLERFDALLELHDIPKRFEFVGRDERRMAAVVGAAIVLNSPDPEIRARAWTAMEGVEDDYLVGPLVDSLLLDPSDLVRVEAAKLLAHEYSGDPRAQSTLQHALLTDLSPRVRTHARWATLDADGRRRYLVATLGNRGLSDPERLELIAADIEDIRNFIDQRALGSLIEIAYRARPTSTAPAGPGEPDRVDAALVVPILLENLRNGAIPEYTRISIASSLSRHLSEPGVRETIETLAAQTTPLMLRREAQAILLRSQPPVR